MRTYRFSLYCLFFLLLFLGSGLQAQDIIEQNGYYSSPSYTPYGIVFTDNYSSAIYIKNGSGIRKLVSAPGCGNYYTVSPDGRTAGFKLIDENGLQAPALIDLETGSITTLCKPVKSCGQVSFSSNGRIAYTIGNELIVKEGSVEKRYDLGYYSNLAPLSPDGNSVSFNDANDRLWILNLSDGKAVPVNDDSHGYFNPQWSPDGKKILYSSLNSNIFVFEPSAARNYALGEGRNPSWSPDSKNILFSKAEIKEQQLTGSDIYMAAYDGGSLMQITSTPDIMEMEPRFGKSSEDIIYQTYSSKRIAAAKLNINAERKMSAESTPFSLPTNIEINHFTLPKLASVQALDIPYVHQKYDVPDWFNGSWACGATTAAMVIAYYKLLPKWETTCSSPYSHTSSYGRYVCDKYYFRQRDYSIGANDPNGKPGYGGFGYMWSSASPYSTIAGYYSNHGISSATSDAPAHSKALAEINAGYPFTVCVELTSAGHIVVAHGIGAEQHTLVYNDAWGNKNNPGYPNYTGKNAMYDWPGYNNGYQNLKTVYWGTTCRGGQAAQADTVVDDLQFEKGFVLSTKAPSSMTLWRDKTQGYKGHLWYLTTRGTTAKDTSYAEWHPVLGKSGTYEVSAYIPFSTATVAPYKIYHDGGVDTVKINQKPVTNAWVSLGRYYFTAGKGGYVRLGDATGIKGEFIVFDAVKWSLIDTVNTDVKDAAAANPGSFAISQNYPNPFNPSTSITYSVPSESWISLRVYNMLGQEIAVLFEGRQNKGVHTVSFNAANMPSGNYICRLEAGNYSGTIKMQLIK